MNDNELTTPNRNKRINAWLPFILLTLVGLCVFLTEKHDGGFVPGGFYSGVSVHGITLSKNLMNSEYPLFMYTGKELYDGKKKFDAYNRFPVFPFLLTGFLIHPFEKDYSLQIYIARQLMNVFFFLALIMVFKLVNDLFKNKYLALSVAFITFSSYYMLTYNNLIFNDIPALLGFVVALYCIAKTQKTKLKIPHILFYSLFPITFGWQPFAVYATWLIIDVLESIFPKEKTTFRAKIQNIFRQTSFVVTGFAIIWGVVILGLQLLNEWRIVGGSFMDIPSVSSALWRSGLDSATGHTQFTWLFDWFNYLPAQAHSIILMLIPFWPIFQVEPGINASVFLVIFFIVFIFIRYLKDKNSINKIYLVLTISGLLWAITMRRFVALHEFQSIFYLGFTIAVYLTLLSHIKLMEWKLLAVNITIVFLITVSLSNHLKTPNAGMNRLMEQFQSISNNLPTNSKVYFDGDRHQVVEKYAIDFFLVGHMYTQLKDAE